MSKSLLVVTMGVLFLSGCATTNNNDSRLGNWKEMLSTSKDVNDPEDRLSKGLYATVGVGASRMEPDTSEMAAWDTNDRVEPAGQVTIGADLTKHLSVEAHSADLGSAGLSPQGRINYHINGVSALVYAGGNRDRYRRQGLSPYGRIGVGALENSPVGDVPYVQTNATHVLLGAGLEYMTPIGIGLRAEGIAFDTDAKYAQLALMYRTGKKQSGARPKLAQEAAPEAQPITAAAAPSPMAMEVPSARTPCSGLGGTLNGVDFHSDTAGLTIESVRILNRVAQALRTCDGVEVEVQAHTDSTGPASYNQALSERRAQSVVEYLNARGLNSVSAIALGETRPIDSNDTAQGRARNRRVEIYTR